MPGFRLNTLSSYIDHLQASGLYTFTHEEIPFYDARSAVSVEAALRRLKKKGRIVAPRRGFFVIVPLEYRATGSPPASWFVHDLMGFLEQPYYVGLLTAAGLHGAAHQQPMVFQVVTDRPTREVRAGEIRIEYHMSNRIDTTPVTDVQTDTGSMRASTPEATAFDLVRFPEASGHLSNVATVLGELAETMNPRSLQKLADTVRLPEVQRLGYLLDTVGKPELADPLADWLKQRPRRAVRLRPDGRRRTRKLDRRWHVLPNETIEVDS
jgi:predicted transcriptional regulator of viral defense system